MPFSLLDALAVVLWPVVVPWLVGVPLVAAGVDLSALTGVPFALLLMVIQLFVLGGVLLWLQGREALDVRLLGPLRPRWRHVGIGVGVGVAGWLLVTTVMVIIARAAGIEERPEQQLLTETMRGGLAAILGVFAAVVMASVVEEVIYRGVAFQAIRSRLGLFPAMFLSAAVFAVAHVELREPLFLLGIGLLGLWLAAVFHRTGTLVVPIVGHATFNAITLLVASAAPTLAPG